MGSRCQRQKPLAGCATLEISSEPSEVVMARVYWPLPYDRDSPPNPFEIVGRYIAQTIVMERFIDFVLLDTGMDSAKLMKTRLSDKIRALADVIARPDLGLEEWRDLPVMMRKVSKHRNAFAHRMFERNDVPHHFTPTVEYVGLGDNELMAQVREAFEASEVCRQLAERLRLAPLNPGRHFGRSPVVWPND